MGTANDKKEDPEIEALFDSAIEDKNAGDYNSAIKKLTALLEKDSQYGPAYLIKGWLLEEEGNLEESFEYYKKAVGCSPKHELASLKVFHYLWDKDDKYNALEEMKRFIAAGGHSDDYDEILEEIKEKWHLYDDKQ